ncbi:unnamed protein product, partial [Meganyctiphanes norvegica]
NTLVGPFPSMTLGKLDELTEFLKRILLCDFSEPKVYWKEYRRGPQYQNVPLQDLYDDLILNPLWSTSNLDELFCKSSDVVLTKQIVVPIKQSIHFLKDYSMNPYILHLVRDPRSILSSRQNMMERDQIINQNEIDQKLLNSTLLCRNLKENLHQVEIIKEQFPKRYLLVRYEDLTRETEFTILQILAWLDVQYNAKIATTIAVNTLGFAHPDAHEHLFSTIRNTSHHHHAWRRHLGFNDVLSIQEECKDVMDGLGYRIYNTSAQYMDPDIHPVNPLPSGIL